MMKTIEKDNISVTTGNDRMNTSTNGLVLGQSNIYIPVCPCCGYCRHCGRGGYYAEPCRIYCGTNFDSTGRGNY